ncbi:ribonuclease H-like domain-containing protein [Tanacetum coccineum]
MTLKLLKKLGTLLLRFFNDNKRTRSIALKAELRSLKLGDLSIDAYFRKIESIATILTSLGSPISSDDVVTIAIEGLNDKYDDVVGIIVHKEPFPNLKTIRFMLTTKEMRLKSKSQATHVDSSSSSPKNLMVELSNTSRRSNVGRDVKLSKLCFNFAKGYCRFGHETILPYAFSAMTLHDPTTSAWNMDTGASSYLNDYVTSLSDVLNMCIYPPVSVGDNYSIPVTNTRHSILPTPHRPLHLNNVLIIPNIVKKIIYARQFVHDNHCTVEFSDFGFSIKDFMTRRVLLRCDNTRDLYPITKPSPIPHVFLTGQQKWH